MEFRPICIILAISLVLSAQPSKQTTTDDLLDRPVDISQVKSDHYKKMGFEILPTFFADSTIGPGNFVGIEDVTVRKGTRLRVWPGTCLMFESNKRLIIEGRLEISLPASEPAIFTNVPLEKRYFRLQTADSLWGGIIAEKNSIIDLSNCQISNAIRGIGGVEKPDSLMIDCVNMQNNVTITLSLPQINLIDSSDGSCVSAKYPMSNTSGLNQKTDSLKTRNTSREKRIVLKVSLLSLTVAGIGVSGYGAYLYQKNLKSFNNSTDPSKYNKVTVDKYEAGAKKGRSIAVISGIATALAGAGFALTFKF
jgi:hypothetical protein